jgi:hypothetical protein
MVGTPLAVQAVMRKTSLLLLAILLLSVARPAAADERLSLKPPELMEARRLKTAGIVLTCLGLVLEGVAIGILSSGEWVDGNPNPNRQYSFGVAGVTTAVSAAVVMGIGIPLWSVGAKREKKIPRSGLVFTPTGLAGTF